MENIAIVVPTYNRLKNIKRCLANFEELDYPEIEIVIVCDGDLETYNKLMLNHSENVKLFLIDHQELVKATRYGIEHCKSEFLVYYNDDMVMNKDCLKIAMNEFKSKFKDEIGLIGFDDSINKWIGTVGLTTKKTIKKFDAWNPCYIHYYADTEIGLRTLRAKCFYWSHDAKVEHLHPLVNKAPWDKTYKDSEKNMLSDSICFTARNGVYKHLTREELEHES